MKPKAKKTEPKKRTFQVGGYTYPDEQFREVLEAWIEGKPLPKPK
jgi:hypothetical protein